MRRKKDNSYAPRTTELGGHIVATATGLCVMDCPACERADTNFKFLVAIVVTVFALGILLKACGC